MEHRKGQVEERKQEEEEPVSLLCASLMICFIPSRMAFRVGHIPVWKAYLAGTVAFILGLLIVQTIQYVQCLMVVSHFPWFSTLSWGERFTFASTRVLDLFSGDTFQGVVYGYFFFVLFIVIISSGSAKKHLRKVDHGRKYVHCIRVTWLLTVVPLILGSLVVGCLLELPRPEWLAPPMAHGEKDQEQYENYLRSKDYYRAFEQWKYGISFSRSPTLLLLIGVMPILLVLRESAFPVFQATPGKTWYNVEGHPICHDCGYDLYGSDFDGFCPECGMDVADSVDESDWQRIHM